MEEFGRRRDIGIEDFQTTIISREDLILSKLSWAKDSVSEMQLRDVSNLLVENCDTDYLRRWDGSNQSAPLMDAAVPNPLARRL